jgi:polo-like kinase 1
VQALAGVKYLHSHKIIHRDLKLGNLFLTEKMEEKIGDFGLATKLEFEGDKRRTICGTPNYIAPEILDSKQGHSYEVDIWSLGIVLYILLIGKPPFEAADLKSTYRRIRTNDYSFPEQICISREAKDLIIKILNLDPYKRPKIDDIMVHPFLSANGTVPKLMPVSFLACPPSEAYIKQFSLHSNSKEAPGLFSLQNKASTPPLKAQRFILEDNKLNGKSTLSVWVKEWLDYREKYGMCKF